MTDEVAHRILVTERKKAEEKERLEADRKALMI